MIFRPLNNNDYNYFLLLLNEFRKTHFSYEQFTELLEKQKQVSIYVLEDIENKQIIGTGTILFEQKFIHNISLYSHIEDIIIKKEYRGYGYGKKLIEHLIKVCKQNNCYKILLDCESKLEYFYEKCGFENKGSQMVIYCNNK